MRISDWSSDVCSSDLPADVDTAQLYDGFSFQALAWIESLGFCEIGDGGKYIEGGLRIALDGELPLNTFGGQICAGRLHGFGFAHEAVTQLSGNGGARKITRKQPRVSGRASWRERGCHSVSLSEDSGIYKKNRKHNSIQNPCKSSYFNY